MKYSTVITGFVVLFAACTDAQQTPAQDEQALTAQGTDLASQFVERCCQRCSRLCRPAGPSVA